MSVFKKGLEQYKRVYTILTMGGDNIPMERLMQDEKIENALIAVIKLTRDLPVANAVIDTAEAGRSHPNINRDVTITIEKLFYARAKELIAETADIKRLQKWDKQIDAYVKKEKGECCNNLKSFIKTRIDELSN